MKNKIEKLTVKQALELGYESFVYDSDGYQSIKPIDPEDIDWKRDDISLVEKESFSPMGLEEDILKEMIIESIWLSHHDNTGDDTNSIAEALKPLNLDLSNVKKQIDEALSELKYYKSSGIKLR